MSNQPKTALCAFEVVADTREQAPYSFQGLRTNADQGGLPLVVTVRREGLPVGDYSIAGHPEVVIERKTKADLFGSVVKRANFESRLERMNELAWAAIVVEAELSELLKDPPRFTRYSPKSLVRTVLAWMQRYPGVHWVFCPGRAVAEETTFRLLERWYLDHLPKRTIRADALDSVGTTSESNLRESALRRG